MDLRAFEDLDPFAAETTDPLEDLSIDLYHRLIEDYGSNPDDPDRGVGITNRLNGPFSPSIGDDIENDFLKDDRVTACKATVTLVSGTGNAGKSYDIDIEVQVSEETLNLAFAADTSGNVRRRF